MKTILAGKSRYMEALRPALHDAGFDTIAVETVSELKELPKEYPVILLQDTALNPLITNKKAAEKAIHGLEPKDLIVFLMDQNQDASPYIENCVLHIASHLAGLKRNIAVLLRSSRASDSEFDERYRTARKKGVAFVKYESIDLGSDDGKTRIELWDGRAKLTMETPLCILCEASPASELYAFADALHVRTYGDRAVSGSRGVSGGRWFLNQGTTLKRNVKLIHTDSLDQDVRSIVPSLIRELKKLYEPGQEKIAFVDSKKCAFCYTCYRVCPHSALAPDEDNEAMKAEELLCGGCGICVSVCPAGAISFRETEPEGTSDFREAEPDGTSEGEAVAQHTEAIGQHMAVMEQGTGASGKEVPKLKIFCCENSAFPLSAEALSGINAAIQPVACGGEISTSMVLEALKQYDSVLAAVCSDDACKHRDGNKRCTKQMERLKERLEKLGYNPNRISSVRIGITMADILREAALTALKGEVR
ncbi:MAG: methyl-viologen-reducing hydrogenase delta subunit [Bacillota bacterium]|jgi:coenzyme F420-reducing hydrogenase delta subunit/Pyruvate/2-oxoacid:ferredoxin oxidoreductase delta subunit|nr:methyl-viologen-reducing hydrogenase delta subunit [Bacillota bacterium]